MKHRMIVLAALGVMLVWSTAGAEPSYRSFIEWNGPYYHVRHALNADSSAYLDYLVNTPQPLYSSPFSSPTAVALFENSGNFRALIVDHDHHRVQVFNANALWKVEALQYTSSPVQGYYGGQSIKFTRGHILPASEHITINSRAFERVNSLTGYGADDSVYTIVYDGIPNMGGVVTLPTGWDLDEADSVRVEYGYANPAGGILGENDIDYVLTQTTPTDIPLQLHEATSTSDPAMSDLSAIAVNASVRSGPKVADIYLINALAGGSGTLGSYDLSDFGTGGSFDYVDTYPGSMGRPYDVEMVDRGANTAPTVAAGATSGVLVARLNPAPSVTNLNVYRGHDYRLAYRFDTTSAMNPSATPSNLESDMAFDEVRGRLHMAFCRDAGGAKGVRYSYSDDYGETWSSPLLIGSAAGAVHNHPRIAVRSTGAVHVVYEAQDGSGEFQLYHTFSTDGISWQANADVTSSIVGVTDSRYANLLVEPETDKLHLVFAADGALYHMEYNESWGVASEIAAIGGAAFSAPHAVISNMGRIYCAYASGANTISYLIYNGTAWGSYQGGGVFQVATADPVTTTGSAGFAAVGGAARGVTYPCPQIVQVGDTVWVFWVGDGTDSYFDVGATSAQIYYNQITSLIGDFTPGAGTAITTGDDAAPMRFSAAADAEGNIYIGYPFAVTAIDEEGLRYKTRMTSTGWFPATTAVGRNIYLEGAAATQFAYEPRLIVPSIAGQMVPMLACGKAYTLPADFGERIVFKIIDGVLLITDQTLEAEIQQWRVWTHSAADESAIPGTSYTITNLNGAISNTDDGGGANEFGVGDYFELTGTEGAKNDLLFVTDCDSHRVKVLRAYDNIDDCFGGNERWDVPGQSDGTPSQTFKLACVGGEGTFTVWGSMDSTPWTIVDNLLIAGSSDRVCEVDRYTGELRFGDDVHGAIPPAGTFVRVRYHESVDEAEFGTLGGGAGQMNHPHGLAARYNSGLGQYDVYVCDAGNDRLQKFAYRPDTQVNPSLWASSVAVWSVAAADTDLIDSPEDIEVTTYNSEVYLVASDNDHARLVVYRDDEATGAGGNTPPAFVAEAGGYSNFLNGFLEPRGLAVMAEDSGLMILAADEDRDVIAKLLWRDWLIASLEDSALGGGQGSNVLLITNMDALDNDNYLLLQPGAVRTVELRLSRADSLVALRAAGTFPAAMIEILSIGEGNLWSGERYTNKVFLFDYDNATGQFEVNTSMVGDDDGLTSAATRVVASIVIRADSTMAIPASGTMAYSDSTELRKAGNRRVLTFNRSNLNLRGGYLADIASAGGNPGNAPNMIPQPDGRINFADVNVFTQGWNGNGVIFDPIADIGPYIGTDLPYLVAAPDDRLDAYDLLSLSTMYNWYNSAGPMAAPLPPDGGEARGTDGGRPVVAAVRQEGELWMIELQGRDVVDLTTAHLYVEVQTMGATVIAAHPGEFLGEGNTLFLQTTQGAAADLCLGRLNRESPGMSGSGVLARLTAATPGRVKPKIRLVYELRDCHNLITGAADITDVDVETIPERFGLSDPYPNPFNASTTFTLNLDQAGLVSLRVYNVLGQQTVVVMQRELPAGVHRIVWDAREASGDALPTGVYFARLEMGARHDIRKMVLVR